MTRVRLGYFEDFKSTDTLLMEADAEGLRGLATVFRSLAAGTLAGLALHDLPFLEAHHGAELTATCGSNDRGTRRGDAGNFFLWERTIRGWQDAADMLEVLIQHEGACHQYLDAGEDEVVVQVSKGEYGDVWWLRHG